MSGLMKDPKGKLLLKYTSSEQAAKKSWGAGGYEAFDSRKVNPSNGEVTTTQMFRKKKPKQESGTVVKADAQPASGKIFSTSNGGRSLLGG